VSGAIDLALLQTLAVPFGAALAAALAGVALGWTRAGLAIALGVLLGDLAGHAVVAGAPTLPPQGAVDKLPWLALGGAMLGLAGQRLHDERGRFLLTAAGAGAALLWLGWPRLLVPQAQAWGVALLLWAGAGWALWRLRDVGRGGGALLLIVATAAAAGIALYGSSYRMAQLIGVLAAALAGSMAVAGAVGAGFGPAARLAVAGPLLGLVAMLAFYTSADSLALLLLLPIFLADRVLVHLPSGAAAAGPRRTVLLAGLALVPAGAAVAVAVWRSGPLYF